VLFRSIESDEGCSHGTDDKEKTKKFTKLAMTKFNAVEDSIERNGYGLFLDSDVFFTNKINDRVISLLENKSIDSVLCAHMTNNLGLESQVGHYNTGMFSLRSVDMLRKHVTLSSDPSNGFYTDQQAIQFAAYEHIIVGLPINYNIGWWRFNEKHNAHRINFLNIQDNKLKFGNDDAVCFHVHTLKSLDYPNYGQFLVDRVVQLLDSCNNDDYKKISAMIKGNL
jgi:lipopolysaccharide biosynthesis glycosyltransferase